MKKVTISSPGHETTVTRDGNKIVAVSCRNGKETEIINSRYAHFWETVRQIIEVHIFLDGKYELAVS